jgi:hypothetical protein
MNLRIKYRWIAGEKLFFESTLLRENVFMQQWMDAISKIDLKQKLYDTFKKEWLRSEIPYRFDNTNRLLEDLRIAANAWK